MFPNLNNSNNKEYPFLLITSSPTLSYFRAKAKDVLGNVFPTSIPLHTSQGYKDYNKKHMIHELVKKKKKKPKPKPKSM
jgi:hypothetical protein